jgi:hypothetical protein
MKLEPAGRIQLEGPVIELEAFSVKKYVFIIQLEAV